MLLWIIGYVIIEWERQKINWSMGTIQEPYLPPVISFLKNVNFLFLVLRNSEVTTIFYKINRVSSILKLYS